VTEYTRVTIQGEGRKADLVLPDDETVAAMLPDVLVLLDEGEARSARPVALVTRVGEQLDSSLTLAEQSVEHGALLRIVRVDEAPPPPEVADVTDVVADAVDSRADAWRPVWGVVAASVLTAVLGAYAALVAVSSLDVQLVTLLAVCAGVAVVASVLCRRHLTGPAVVLTAGAVGGAAVAALLVSADQADGTLGTSAIVWFGLTSLLVGLVGAAGARDVGLGLGGVVGTVLVGALAAMHALGWERLHSAAVVAVVGTLLLGLLPGIAMTVSGLSGLDDRVVEGNRIPRAAARRAVDATHRALTWATVATAVVVGSCAWVLAGAPDTATRVLTACLAVVLLLRTRVLPLAPQRLVLMLAGLVPLVALLVDLGSTEPEQAVGVALGVAVLVAALVGSHPSEYLKARLRGLANIVELIAVLALVPLVLARLGVFADLVGTF